MNPETIRSLIAALPPHMKEQLMQSIADNVPGLTEAAEEVLGRVNYDVSVKIEPYWPLPPANEKEELLRGHLIHSLGGAIKHSEHALQLWLKDLDMRRLAKLPIPKGQNDEE